MTNEKARPDYVHWSKYDKWDFKQAALLLHELEPSHYRNIHFNSKDIPAEPELKEPYKTFLVLKKCRDFEYSNFAHPMQIIVVANKKGFEIPKGLINEFAAQHEREKDLKKDSVVRNQNAGSKDELATRERNVFLKAVALMTHMLTRNSSRFEVNNRPNPHQISMAILEKAESMGVDTTGLKSFERKITEALAFLEEEKETEF